MFEAFCQVFFGYIAVLIVQSAIFPIFGIHIPLTTNMTIVFITSIVSFVKSYAVRRCFCGD